MSHDGSMIGAAASGVGALRSGVVGRRADAPDLLADVARLTKECETLRHVAAARTADMETQSRRTDELIADTSHDIKTPLTAILGSAQYAVRLLATPTPDLDKVGHLLEVVQDQGVMMTGLLDDLIDASRCQLGALELRPTSCDLGEILTTVLSRLTSNERGRIDVMVPSMSLAGYWDENRVERVLANLIGNGLKYSPDDARMSVVVMRRDVWIEVAVNDCGMGIPADELAQIFERFHRTPQAQASRLVGTGLGLYICRCVVAAHGGSLWAESPGEQMGATFRFTLPGQPHLG